MGWSLGLGSRFFSADFADVRGACKRNSALVVK
jgi:hypothetical protein